MGEWSLINDDEDIKPKSNDENDYDGFKVETMECIRCTYHIHHREIKAKDMQEKKDKFCVY